MTGKDRQSVADMALEQSGSAEGMFLISRGNGISLDEEVSGLELTDIPELDKDVVQKYSIGKHEPANHFHIEEEIITDESGTAITTEDNNNLEYEI